MAENATVTTNRDKYMERLKTRYPDKEFADDEELFARINDDYDNYDNELSGYEEREKALSDLFTSNPRSAAFLIDWRNGEDPVVGLVRKFGNEFKDALEDPEKQEALAAANKEFAERIAKEEEFEEAYQKNIEETNKTLDALQEEMSLSDEDVEEAMRFLIGIMKDGIVGKFTADSIKMALKAIRHDEDVEEAEHAGEVRGRNMRIEEKLRKNNAGDGTASLGGRNGGGERRSMPDMGAIDRYSGLKNIWERGGEKRTKTNQ